MRFAVLADAHIGRSIPLAIAEHRRKAFCRALTKTVNAIIEERVDYIFICGDLFERRTLRPHLVQFTQDELYRLANETEERHGILPSILLIRGNHDGRPQSNTLDYLKHPLAEYLHIFEEKHEPFTDGEVTVVGLNYYDRIDVAFERFAKPKLKDASGIKVLMVHGFISGYNAVPTFSNSLTLDQLSDADPDYVFAGHYHLNCRPRLLPNGGWVLTPGSLEMYDFAERPEKGIYIIDHSKKPIFNWIPIEPMHHMKQVRVETERRQTPKWFSKMIHKEVQKFQGELVEQKKNGYLRIRVRGLIRDGFPSDIDLKPVELLVDENPQLLWVDVNTLGVEMPLQARSPEREKIDVGEFFSSFGDFAQSIKEMHGLVWETLEEEASVVTGLLTPSQRSFLVEEWVRRFESRNFSEEER